MTPENRLVSSFHTASAERGPTIHAEFPAIAEVAAGRAPRQQRRWPWRCRHRASGRARQRLLGGESVVAVARGFGRSW